MNRCRPSNAGNSLSTDRLKTRRLHPLSRKSTPSAILLAKRAITEETLRTHRILAANPHAARPCHTSPTARAFAADQPGRSGDRHRESRSPPPGWPGSPSRGRRFARFADWWRNARMRESACRALRISCQVSSVLRSSTRISSMGAFPPAGPRRSFRPTAAHWEPRCRVAR